MIDLIQTEYKMKFTFLPKPKSLDSGYSPIDGSGFNHVGSAVWIVLAVHPLPDLHLRYFCGQALCETGQ